LKKLKWDPQKSLWLKDHRGALFEEIVQAEIVAIKSHPNRSHQNMMLFNFQDYIWVVPYVENDSELFLKTAYRSRKYTKHFKKGDLRS
jgi:hypothetical protein